MEEWGSHMNTLWDIPEMSHTLPQLDPTLCGVVIFDLGMRKCPCRKAPL
jgi:hypothetical protein